MPQAGFPIIRCACSACGDQDMKRAKIKNLLAELEQGTGHQGKPLLAALADMITGICWIRRVMGEIRRRRKRLKNIIPAFFHCLTFVVFGFVNLNISRKIH
jgi:hypothetical protein